MERYGTKKAKYLQPELKKNADWLIKIIRQELEGALGDHPLGNQRPVAGGRVGLNPSSYYLNPRNF